MYRYYVTADLQQGGSVTADAPQRLSAPAVEEFLTEVTRRLLARPELEWTETASLISRLDVYPRSLLLTLDARRIPGGARSLEAHLYEDESLTRSEDHVIVEVPACVRRGGRTWIATPSGRAVRPRPINKVLVRALKVAHAALKDSGLSPEARPEGLAGGAAPANSHDRKLCLLAFLAPDIQSAILTGRQPANLTLEQLTSETLPLAWDDQRRALGF
jgi:hypothetical protein